MTVFSESFPQVGGRQLSADLVVVPDVSAGTRTVPRTHTHNPYGGRNRHHPDPLL
jgi:hypothetical protein